MRWRMGRRRPSIALASVLLMMAPAPLCGGPVPGTPPVCAPPAVNPVACENTNPGASPSVWDLTDRAGDPSIEGYATRTSVNVGETVDFKVRSTASSYRIDIFRLGWYGGAGARQISTVAPAVPLPQSQPPCISDADTGLVDCGNWAVSASWAVPATTVSGIYLARLVRPDTGGNSHMIFVVRDDTSHSDLYVQAPDATWAAYNRYGGNSLYRGSPAGRAYKVSFNRPDDVRGREFTRTSMFNDIVPMVRFLERNGYDLSYTTNTDVDSRGPGLLRQHKAFLSIGHDEYWSAGQRATVEAARDAGVNLAFFSGNEVFWKTRFEPSVDGTNASQRTLVSYKESMSSTRLDPSGVWTGTWRDPRFSPPADGGRPENALTGTMFMVNCCQFEPITVSAEEGRQRFWRHTDLGAMTTPSTEVGPAILGYEVDADVDNGFRPAGQIGVATTNLDGYILVDNGDRYAWGSATHRLTYHRVPSGALVFGAGTVHWSWSLDTGHDADDVPLAPTDRRIQQATVNVLADMGAQPATPQPDLVATTASADTANPVSTITSPAAGATVASGSTITATGTATDTGGRVGGVEVSVDGGTTWHPATGTGTWSYTFTPSSTGPLTVRSRATDDSVNTEQPGPGVTVTIGNRTCPCSLFGPTATPGHTDWNERVPITLGVRIEVDRPGRLTAVRFYKAPGSTGTNVVHVWSESGQSLATATATGGTASGWQQVNLATPVTVSPGTRYVVSYHSPSGLYAGDNDTFATALHAAPLHAPASGAAGGNGVYRDGADAFPTDSYRASNYYVDAVFEG